MNFTRLLCPLATQALLLELSPLVRSFNEALLRLEHAHDRRVRLLVDAAHELKALALLRCQLELEDAGMAELLADLGHLARRVQRTLTLAEVTESRNYRYVFERYKRAASRRDSGVELGLAIRHETAFAHGWQREARSLSQGAGFQMAFN